MKNKENTKGKKYPHVLFILFVVLVCATILTWIIPAGNYERVLNEETGKMVIDASSFQYVDKTPVGPLDMFLAVEEGLIDAANITFLIFAAFACMYVLEKTGALDAAISRMVKFTNKNPKYSMAIIAVIMFVLSAWASTGTMSYEEIIAFIPIFTALCLALGYDSITALGISVIPVGMGFASATLNPFSIGVAQQIAELPLFSGLKLRVAILLVMTTFTIVYVLRYATKVKKDPTKSLVYDIDYSDLIMDEERMNTPFTIERKLSILTLFVGIGVMAYGLIRKGWYINEVASIFMIISLLVGIINKWSAKKICDIYVQGLSAGVLSALIVGFARGILMVFSKGNILDTIIFSFANVLQNLSLYVSGLGMLIFQTLLNFLIPSGSGQAAVSMPIMVPLADLIGMNRQIAVLIFQFGDGFSNLIWPTGFMIIACTVARIPLNKYYKFMVPFFAIGFVIQVIFIFIAISIGYGPF